MRRRAFLVVLFAAVPLAARAHHGWGSYDSDRPLTLSGVVERVSFENPHGILILRTPDKVWEVVLAPPFRMINRGLHEHMIRPGQVVEIMGYPHRTRDVEIRAEWIKVNGTITQLR
ncbi:MAG: DUF6152 family protein [Geminicoccaceae bacterium]|nr:DUF6152 family protein [Geminicoccaceae bacterium]MCX7629900.1 DUF6152 family protein [Geminicoccaceae bacterium]MDW8125942.1 DUF6152 family protein [Geminicoccaceae bacterium]MDW8340279.1 DUF6152 family protein [Geminicoccaceae bacterium]